MIIMQKDPTRSFTVLNLSDPQLDGSYLEKDSEDCRFLLYTVSQLVLRSKPDLITITGDLGYGDDETYLQTCKLFADFLDHFQIPWSVIWGNHDNQGGAQRICETVALFETYPNFVYESGDAALGNGNFVIEVQENGKPVQGLVMMDTHNRAPYVNASGETEEAWAKLWPEQLDWYEQQIRQLQAQGCPKTVLLTHIPIYAYRKAIEAALRPDLDPKAITPEESCTGRCWNEGYADSFGVRYEEECSYPADEGAFERIRNLGSTQLLLCGHDHVNCWCVNYEGVRLAYALKTGRGCYFHPELNGGTVLQITSDGEVSMDHLFIR